MSERPFDVTWRVRAWLDKADGDLRVAELLLEAGADVPPSAIGFHAQQAVEKYLKAVLEAEGTTPPREHGITRLRELVGYLPLTKHLHVTQFAVLERYPRLAGDDSPEPPMQDAERAVFYAHNVRRTVRHFLGYDRFEAPGLSG